MSVGSVHVLHGIKLPSGTFISQLEDATPKGNHEILMGYGSGHPERLFVGIRGQKPDLRFTSMQVASMLTAFGFGGVDLSSATTKLFYKVAANHGSRVANATTQHKLFQFYSGFGMLQGIELQHQQDAKISARIIPLYDGTHPPIVPIGSQALTDTPSAAEWYTLGPVKINGSFVGGEQSVSVEMEDEAFELSSGGEAWSTFAGTKQLGRTITIRTLELQPWVDYGLTGAAISAVSIFLRAKAGPGNGANLADSATSHIRIDAAAGLILPDDAQGAGNEPVSDTLKLYVAASSGTAASLTVTQGVAIS